MAERYNEIERLKRFYDLTRDVTTPLVSNLLGNTTKHILWWGQNVPAGKQNP
jgi:hypothetical protein